MPESSSEDNLGALWVPPGITSFSREPQASVRRARRQSPRARLRPSAIETGILFGTIKTVMLFPASRDVKDEIRHFAVFLYDRASLPYTGAAPDPLPDRLPGRGSGSASRC